MARQCKNVRRWRTIRASEVDFTHKVKDLLGLTLTAREPRWPHGTTSLGATWAHHAHDAREFKITEFKIRWWG